MTRVWNRRGVMTLLEREWSEAMRGQKPVSIVVGDVDHFKSINDTLGHAGGDDVLKSIAKTLLDAVRVEDAVGRMGGEEFIVILPGMTAKAAKDTVERLRKTIQDTPVMTNGQARYVTMSFGLTMVKPTANGPSIDNVIKQADEALYAAKRSGRNRVEIAA